MTRLELAEHIALEIAWTFLEDGTIIETSDVGDRVGIRTPYASFTVKNKEGQVFSVHVMTGDMVS